MTFKLFGKWYMVVFPWQRLRVKEPYPHIFEKIWNYGTISVPEGARIQIARTLYQSVGGSLVWDTEL